MAIFGQAQMQSSVKFKQKLIISFKPIKNYFMCDVPFFNVLC